MSKQDYVFKTVPFLHQAEIHNESKDLLCYALFCEQGTGKSKSIIDTAVHLYINNKIDALLIAAWPNGVHLNWVDEEVPAHLPDHIPYQMAYWVASPKVAERRAIEAMLVPAEDRTLKIFTINIEALATKRGRAYVLEFLKTYRTLWTVDESTCISNPKAAQTKGCLALRKHATYRRILTGTPALEGPMKLYTQMQFLHESILGFTNYYAFRARYAVLVTEEDPRRFDKHGLPKTYKRIVSYQNIEELSDKIAPYSFRVLKEDCLDLPPKLHEPSQLVELSSEQRIMYRMMADKLLIELEDGSIVSAAMTLTKLLRLQQILGGFLKDETGREIPVPGVDPRLKAFMIWAELINPERNKALVWCRYKYEINNVGRALINEYGPDAVVEYSGRVNNEQRRTNKRRFQEDDKVRFMVLSKAGALGLTLTAASFVAYYSHQDSMLLRAQSEDRPHRIGQEHPVTYTNFEARNVPVGISIDTKILQAYKKKQSLSDLILKDPPKNWLM